MPLPPAFQDNGFKKGTRKIWAYQKLADSNDIQLFLLNATESFGK